MALIQATDVVMMGWLGARPLAASALGINLNFALSLLCLGLVTASSPMIATALGRRASSGPRGPAHLSPVAVADRDCQPPVWAVLWFAEPIILALGQDRGLAEGAATFLRGYMWSMLPFLLFQAMRNFVSALERPGWVLAISLMGIVLNGALGWTLIFGHFGFPALGLFGGGLASSIVWTLLVLALAAVIMTDRQFRRFHLFGRLWRSDWPRYRRLWLLGLPIGLAMGFEGGVFSAAAYLMGLISADAVAAHAVALQIAALSFMVPLGLAQAATVRVGHALGRGDRAGITRAGWIAWGLGVTFMALTALLIGSSAPRWCRCSSRTPPPMPRSSRWRCHSCWSPRFSRSSMARRSSARECCAGFTIRACRCCSRSSAIGRSASGSACGSPSRGWERGRHLDRARAGLAIVAVLMLWRWTRRDTLGLVPAPDRYASITTSSPSLVIPYSALAIGAGRRMQPWLAG